MAEASEDVEAVKKLYIIEFWNPDASVPPRKKTTGDLALTTSRKDAFRAAREEKTDKEKSRVYLAELTEIKE